jgi:GTPase Era involved in 16S rRNA processing
VDIQINEARVQRILIEEPGMLNMYRNNATFHRSVFNIREGLTDTDLLILIMNLCVIIQDLQEEQIKLIKQSIVPSVVAIGQAGEDIKEGRLVTINTSTGEVMMAHK